MHDCPICGQACDCDGEDHWQDPPEDCDCELSHDYDFLGFDFDDDEWPDDLTEADE